MGDQAVKAIIELLLVFYDSIQCCQRKPTAAKKTRLSKSYSVLHSG
jgi:hypothetical protein